MNRGEVHGEPCLTWRLQVATDVGIRTPCDVTKGAVACALIGNTHEQFVLLPHGPTERNFPKSRCYCCKLRGHSPFPEDVKPFGDDYSCETAAPPESMMKNKGQKISYTHICVASLPILTPHVARHSSRRARSAVLVGLMCCTAT